MAKCPNCGRKLRFIDWRSVCPQCGVNLNYFNANEILLDESEKAEIEHARFQPKVDRGKAATIGTNVGRIRLALFIIPLAAFFLPLFTISVSGNKHSYNALDIYNAFSTLDIGGILGKISPLIIAILLIAIPAVCCLVFGFMQLGAGSKKGLKRNIVLSSISLCLALASLVCMLVFAGSPSKGYADLLLNEANFAIGSKDQAAVDSAIKKLSELNGAEAGDISILSDAVKNAEAALKDKAARGYTNEQIAAINDALKQGRVLLKKDDISIDEIRDASSALNSAVSSFNDLETALKYAQLIKPDTYSENSFSSLTSAIEEGKAALDSLKKGEPIVELEDNDGTGAKTPEEIKTATEARLAELTSNVSSRCSSLVNVVAANELVEKTNASLSAGSIENVSASAGIGVFVLLALFIIQIIFHIAVLKKGFEVKYTPTLIGGLPSEEYFRLVEEGTDIHIIRRKMLVALAKMQDEVRLKQEAQEKSETEEKLKEIEERMAAKGNGGEK